MNIIRNRMRVNNECCSIRGDAIEMLGRVALANLVLAHQRPLVGEER